MPGLFGLSMMLIYTVILQIYNNLKIDVDKELCVLVPTIIFCYAAYL